MTQQPGSLSSFVNEDAGTSITLARAAVRAFRIEMPPSVNCQHDEQRVAPPWTRHGHMGPALHVVPHYPGQPSAKSRYDHRESQSASAQNV
jgi:hypothetical protein